MTLFDRILYGLLLFVPLTFLAEHLGMPAIFVFLISVVAIVPLSKIIGDATEELTTYTGPALGGLINATFGNAPELIIAGFALNAGLTEVVKATITGSILSNLVLGLGLAVFVGGMRYKHQKFNATAAKASGSTLLLAVSALIIPAIFLLSTGEGAGASVEGLSIVVALLLIIGYAASLLFSLWTHQHLYASDAADYIPRWSKAASISVLLFATAAVAFVSDALVGTITPVVSVLGWSQMFIGITILSVVGNVAEHVTAIRVALKNNMDLAFQIAIGSATQVAMFMAPALVLLSIAIGKPMTLIFSTFELATLLLSVLIVNSIVEDGDSTWFEGFLLIIAYIIIAATFYLYK